MNNASLLITSLQCAIPLWIWRYQQAGGPTAEDWTWAIAFSEELASRGDLLLFRSQKEGESAEMFNQTARALAIMAFLPGGITFAGEHWEVTDA